MNKPAVRLLRSLYCWVSLLTVTSVSLTAPPSALGSVLSANSLPAALPTVGLPAATACGVILPLVDSADATPLVNTLKVTLDSTLIFPSIRRSGATTFLSINAPRAPGSTHTLAVEFSDSLNRLISQTRDYIVPNFATIPASAAIADFDPESSGFRVRTVWNPGVQRGPDESNPAANTENQLAGGLINPETGQPYENKVNLNGADREGFFRTEQVNFNVAAPAPTGAFSSAVDAAFEDAPIPGIGAEGMDSENLAAEILTYLELGPGCYVFGVNTGGGFTARLGHGPFGLLLGQSDVFTGPGETRFSFTVESYGVYPVRFCWWSGGPGANLEIYSIDPTGKKILVNDRSSSAGVAAYSSGRIRGTLRSLAPYPGWTGTMSIRAGLTASFEDDLTALDPASLQLTVNGAPVQPKITKQGNNTRVQYLPSSFGYQNCQLTYSIGAVTTSQRFGFFAGTPCDLPAGFSIESEQFDFDGGQALPSVSVMPYSGAEYQGKSAIHDIDYHQPGIEPFSNFYRLGEEPDVPMDPQQTDGTADVQRPGCWKVSTNYKIGWVSDEWYNYTRNIPAGNYKIYAAQSHGNGYGEVNRLRARFGIVTAGRGTTKQSVTMIGSYNQPATGGWGDNAIVVVQDNGRDAVVHFSGGTETIRVFVDEGDFDWFALVPTTEPSLPRLTTISPGNGAVTLTGSIVCNFQDRFEQQTVVLPSLRLLVNGEDVSQKLTTSRTDEGVQIRYEPTGGFSPGTVSYTLAYQTSGGLNQSVTGSFVSTGGNAFIVEAEDFNFDGGQTKVEASTMPLSGPRLFTALGAQAGIDYQWSNDELPSVPQLYRANGVQGMVIVENSDLSRGAFDLPANYVVTALRPNDWLNYSRRFYPGVYNVWAGVSQSDAGSTAGALQLVTSDPGAPNQAVTDLGVFSGPGALVPLVESGGNMAAVPLSGLATLRYVAGTASIDFLAFVPVSGGVPVDPPNLSVVRGAADQLTISWTGGGIVEASDSLDPGATWQPINTSGTALITPAGKARFFRVKR